MRFVIITGMSGAGKSNVVRYLEETGYYCVDNMPPMLIINFAEICFGIQGKFEHVAVVCDMRGGDMFNEFEDALTTLEYSNYKYELLFLDASHEVLINRYKEKRIKHPVNPTGLLTDSINKEREILSSIRDRAHYIVDTSEFTLQNLRSEINRIFAGQRPVIAFIVNILSFGFKYGIPLDSDLVFDVRFLPNPFYVSKLKELTGKHKDVSEFVFGFEETKVFTEKLYDMMDFLIPYYIEEGKSQLVVSIGCTGGKHRSVAVAEALCAHLEKRRYNTIVSHRDVKK